MLPINALQCEMAFSRHRIMAVMRPLKQQVAQHNTVKQHQNSTSVLTYSKTVFLPTNTNVCTVYAPNIQTKTNATIYLDINVTSRL